MKPIPLFGDAISSLSPVITSQRRLNCFWDFRKDGDKSNAVLIGTFGLFYFLTLPTTLVRGFRVVGVYLYVVAGNTLYRITIAGTVTSLGTLASNTGRVTMVDNAVQLGIVDGSTLYCYTITTGSYSQVGLNAAGSFGAVTDVNFPNGSTTIDFINGRCLAEKQGSRQYYISGIYDLTAWTPATWATKENYSDNIQGVQIFNSLIILWGAASIEFWQDVGASPLPYQRISGATQTYGLAAKWSRAIVNNKMIFLAVNSQGSIEIMQLNGYTPEKISTSDIESIIEELTVYSDATAVTYAAWGHSFYQITFPTDGRSLLYDASTNLWSEVQTGLGLSGRHIADLCVNFGGKTYVSDYSNGNLYYYSDNSYTDAGQPIKRQLTTRHIRDGGNELRISTVFLEMETGVGLISGQGSDPKISMEKSKDNGRTWGIPRVTSFGKMGQYQTPRAIWNRCGSAKDFVFRFTMTDPVDFIVTGGAASLGQSASKKEGGA